jgi:hypothetical protein
MLNSISSENFQLDKIGANMISMKVNGFGNSISITESRVNELIDMLDKARKEFYPDAVARDSIKKLLNK